MKMVLTIVYLLVSCVLARADVINVSTPANISSPGTVNWDVNNDGTNDFSFVTSGFVNSTNSNWSAQMLGLGSGTTNGAAGTNGDPLIFSIGSAINGSLPFTAPAALGVVFGPDPPMIELFNGGGTAYLGFSFEVGGQTNYGWLLLQLGPGYIHFISAAYENSGESIAAGAVPEPGTMLNLAAGGAGALGILLLRQQRRRRR
jgi:hypothetical protein